MNRYKKEEIKARNEARKGLTKDQIIDLDLEDDRRRRIEALAHELHIELFSEEYVHMYDDAWDVADRKKGINPMSQRYIDDIRNKRNALGVSQLSESGMSKSNDTWSLCLERAKIIIDSQ